MENNKLLSALKYQSIGLSIIPTGKNKKALIEWKSYQDRCARVEEINAWWKIYPNANPALVTGRVSGVVALDLDKKYNRTSKEFQIPPTACARSGNNGEHFFFKYPSGVSVKSGSAISGKGVDCRGDFGYILLDPSVNETGGKYEWVVPLESKENLAEMPEWFKKLTIDNTNDKKWLIGKDGVSEGNRNETATSMAGKIIISTAPELLENIGWDQFKVWNSKNTPPLKERELRNIWESILRYNKGDNNLKNIFQTDPKKGSHEIAKYLIEKYHVRTIGERIREIYIYEDGVYILGQNKLRTDIQEILEELTNINNKNNIIEMVKDLTSASRDDFNVNKSLINLNNGIYNIKNKELIPHNHEYLFFTKIPVDYDVNAKCPVIDKFLNDILSEYYKKIIFEWFGYCLYRSYFIKKAIIFVGERDTGKSTLLKLYKSFIGGDNMSGVSLQKISSDKFASSQLRDRHINIYDDLSFKDINDNGLFKVATGDGIITGEKKFGEQFQFQNFSKLTFACNKIPEVKDINDDAYFGRWIIIPFLAEITKIDKTLTDKITNPKELSGLLNPAISGLIEILEKQDFSYDKTPEEIKKEMLLSGSMVANFANECLAEQIGAWVSKEDMYEECARYAQSNDLPVIDKQILGRKLPNHSGYIIDGTKLIGKKQVQGWRNVKIKGKKETSDQEGKEGIFDIT